MKIDLTEQFQHLPHAPIVEAVIEIRARAEVAWEERVVSEQLKSQLPDYPQVSSQNEFRQEVKFGVGQLPEAKQHNLGWKGLRFQSADQRQVVQFNRDSFVFSRLPPYESWKRLSDEAIRLWRMHVELAHSTEVQRIGLRYINRIVLPTQEFRFEDYIEPHAAAPSGLELPFQGFFHHDTLSVPGYPYSVNVVRTIQPPQDPRVQGPGLVLDIDVFTTVQPIEMREEVLDMRLAEMRWLKNKVFFGSVTQKALASFQ